MQHIFIWIISFLAIAGVITRPFNWSEAIWAVAGAILLVAVGLVPLAAGLSGVGKGLDVYLFLTGMMLLAETAREEKLFDWLAAYATKMAKGSAARLFILIYLVGVVVTAFLSNDATAVVLTPAVAASVKTAKAKKPLPFLLICAFIANAASFLLPISNPANLVIYGSHMPSLLHWLPQYFLPSVFSIVATFFVLRLNQRNELRQEVEANIRIPVLSNGGKTALVGIGFTAIVLLVSSALSIQLGLPTAIAGILTTAIVLIRAKKNPLTIIKGISWAVLPLVAGLFVIVEALNLTGLTQSLTTMLNHEIARSVSAAAWTAGGGIAVICNLMNNLPAGLIAGNVLNTGNIPETVKSAVLIGVDLGPNLSITGSLATLLWLVALRREGINVSAWTFLKLGAAVMTVALIFALGSLWI